MSQAWDFYFARLDGQLASIVLDLGRLDLGVDESRPALLALRLPLREPREDGLVRPEEAAALAELEERLAEALDQAVGALPVGRITCGGARELFFYARQEAGAREAARAALGEAPYAPGFRCEPDPTWETFFKLLAPDERSLRWILDRRVVDQLVSHGDDPSRPRRVEHSALFAEQRGVDAFVEAARELGLEPVPAREDDDADDPPEEGLKPACVAGVQPVTLSHMHPLSCALAELARRHGGVYAGWQSPIVAGDGP